MCRKERFIGPGRLGCGLYRRDHPSKEGGFLFQRTAAFLGPDHQMEQVDIPQVEK
jgi:hypothetical protein